MTWINKYSEIIPGNIYKDIEMNNVTILIQWLHQKLTEYSYNSRSFIAYYNLVPFQADNCTQADLLTADKYS